MKTILCGLLCRFLISELAEALPLRASPWRTAGSSIQFHPEMTFLLFAFCFVGGLLPLSVGFLCLFFFNTAKPMTSTQNHQTYLVPHSF